MNEYRVPNTNHNYSPTTSLPTPTAYANTDTKYNAVYEIINTTLHVTTKQKTLSVLVKKYCTT